MEIHTAIEAIQELSKPVIVAVSGFGGSGKSSLAQKIATEIQASIIGIDSFCKSVEQADYERWEIMDFNRLENEILKPFLMGRKELSYGEFNWEKNQVTETKTIKVNDILIVEGVGLFRPKLLEYYSYTIWVDCPIEIAIARGKKRDREEYGVPQDENWDGIWRENDLECYREFAPLESADCIIKNE